MDTKWDSDHLWFYLLALGFRPKHHYGIRLGRDMFTQPNSKAFSVVARFLFTKLDKHRARNTFQAISAYAFKDMAGGRPAIRKWHSGFRKLPSPRFRKHCTMWLSEISNREELGLPKITPSTLICPGGAKFIHVVYHFARYVMTENMKKLTVGAGIPFVEAVMWEPEDMYIAKARHRVAYNKLLQILQREDFVIQEYKKKTRDLIREIERTKSACAVLEKQSCRMKQNDQNKNDTAEKIQKVRHVWTLIVEMLASLKKEKEIVDSVLEDCVNPCILDGTDIVLSVPGLLTYRVESNIHGFCTGNLYEDGKLNFLTVIQLLNEALTTLRDEHCPYELKELHKIEDVVTSYKKTLQELDAKSLRRKQQHCEPKYQSISRKQEIWESKWKKFLGQCPFNLIFKISSKQPTSSHQSPSSSDEDENTLCQSFSDNYDSDDEECLGKNDEGLETMMDTPLVPSGCHFISPCSRPSVPSLSDTSENGDLLTENNMHTCEKNKTPVPPKILKKGKEEFLTSEMENAGENITQPKSPVEKDDLLKEARDELAEKIAQSVMSESPDSGEEKGMSLDDLISSLSFNPFLTRKQIPRTPENLLTEIRSSWRKAIQTEGSLDLELSLTEVVTEESSMNATLSMQEEVDSSFVCSEPATPLSDFDPSVSEKKSQLSSTESSSQEQVSVGHTFEPSNSKTSGIQENTRTESEELDCSALSGSSVEDPSQTLEYVEKSMNIPDTCLKSGRTNTLLSDCCSFLMDETLCCNVSVLNSVGHETPDMGILDETIPESDSLDLSISASPDSIFYSVGSENLKRIPENNEDVKELDLDIQSLSNSHKVVKSTASKTEEELHQTHNGDKLGSCRAELSTIVEEEEENYDGPSTEMPLPNSPNESKYSLSSLLVSCQQMDGT